MDNRTYHWIQDNGPHLFTRSCKKCHHRERKFIYSILERYGVQADRGLRVNIPCSLTTRRVLIHKGKREIHRMFIYEPLQELNVQNNPMDFTKFQPRETLNPKGWYYSTKDVHHKRHQEINVKLERLRASRLYFDRTLGTSIEQPS